MIGGMSASGGVRAPKKRSKPRGQNCLIVSPETTNRPRVEVSDVDIVGTNSMSICFWYKRPSSLGAYTTVGSNPRWFTQGQDKNNVISLGDGAVSGVIGSCLIFNVKISGGDLVVLESSAHGMSLSTWHHVAVVCDRSSSSNSKIYVDGEALSMETQAQHGSFATTDVDLNAAFMLGGGGHTTGSNGGNYKDWMFYSRVLSDKEIKKIYNHKGRKRLLSKSELKTNLEFYLPLGDTPSGDHPTNSNELLDISGNDRHGTGVLGSGTLSLFPDSPS